LKAKKTMLDPIKIVVLGGSGVATPDLASALAETRGRTRPIELVLVGRSREKLETVAGVARLMTDNDPLIQVTAETDTAAALAGAGIVLNQIRVGGLVARTFDESFPHTLGLPGEETVGPGGFANASRTIPVVLEYARLIEKICPQATLLTFANPSSLVQYAITHYTAVRAVGLCDGPITLIQNIAAAIQSRPEDLVVDYFGMHHFGWATGVWQNGVDVLPQVLANAEKAAPDVDPVITHALGVIPGAYLNYLFHPERMLAKKLGKRTRAEELLDLQDELMAEFAACLARGEKPSGLAKRKARWYRAIITPMMLAWAEGKSDQLIVNLVNNGIVPWLPADAIVEVPALIQDKRFRPLAVGAIPPEVKALIQQNCTYEMLAVEAIVEHSREKALRALLINPMIPSYEQAARTLELAWSWGS
jgi:6-phospho-beta-glucosidase